ncbi:hypothetical protein CTI12_AA072410 [Artemisia annua]|uniref:Uncharacterized protein n=1 Tax=Artemisia annua TaxID=35608 RepID=A0A2U1Q5I5_ARTAN|nr:hypothetical protein CTI12_AA072410 [Artemisia annua]
MYVKVVGLIIFAKGFFKHLNSRVRRPISVVTCHGRYHVDGHVVGGKVYGFDGEAWELLFLKENILEGQKMVLCYLGEYKYRLTVFYHNGVEVHPFKDVFEDDRYDRVVDAAAHQIVLVED